MTNTLRAASTYRFLCAALAITCAAAAQIVTVGPVGSGAMFSSIQAGIQATPPGGVVQIAGGHYVGNATLTIDKPLTLLGSSSTYTAASASSGNWLVLPLRIQNIAADEQVTIIGLQLVSQVSASHLISNSRLAFEVVDCDGPVVLSGVRLGGTWSVAGAYTTASAVIRDSAMVVLDRCELNASAAFIFFDTPTALQVERSLVHVNDCTLLGSRAPNIATPRNGGPAIRAVDATIRVARSNLRGGEGVQWIFTLPNPAGTSGGAAIEATRSTVHVRGGPGNELAGGLGGGGGGPGGAAVFVDALSLVSTSPDVVATAGLNGNQQPSTPAIDGPGLKAPLAFVVPTAAAITPLVLPGNTASFTIDGEPQAFCLPLFALSLSNGFTVPGVLGLFALDPAGMLALPATQLNASGQATTGLTIPPNPALVGTNLHAQALTFAASGWIAVSGPTLAVVR